MVLDDSLYLVSVTQNILDIIMNYNGKIQKNKSINMICDIMMWWKYAFQEQYEESILNNDNVYGSIVDCTYHCT